MYLWTDLGLPSSPTIPIVAVVETGSDKLCWTRQELSNATVVVVGVMAVAGRGHRPPVERRPTPIRCLYLLDCEHHRRCKTAMGLFVASKQALNFDAVCLLQSATSQKQRYFWLTPPVPNNTGSISTVPSRSFDVSLSDFACPEMVDQLSSLVWSS